LFLNIFLRIRKKDINSILPIIINIMSEIFDVVNKLEKFIFFKPYKSELTVLVKVRIDNLKDFSKLSSPAVRKLDRINRLIKKDMKTKKDEVIFSMFILFSVLIIL